MSKPLIWYMLPSMRLGGSEKHVIGLASGLQARGFDARIVTIFEEGILGPSVRKEGIPFECIHAPQSWGLETLIRILGWMRHRPMSILHTYLFGFHVFAGLPAKLLKVPVILSSRRELAHWQKARHRWVENLGNGLVDQVICCSEAARQWTLDKEVIRPEKLLTIYNGVDLKRFELPFQQMEIRTEFGIPRDKPVIGTVANFSYEKGYPYLLEAIERIHHRKPEAWFLLVGSGPLEDEMKKMASKSPAKGQIIFAGNRSDIPRVLAAMDIFVLASLSEGFPNVLLEAMAMARPVVASAVGGIPELVESGQDGILVPHRDSRSLAEAVLHLLDDETQATRLRYLAAEKIKTKFSLERMLDDYEQLYQRILRAKGNCFQEPVKSENIATRRTETTLVSMDERKI